MDSPACATIYAMPTADESITQPRVRYIQTATLVYSTVDSGLTITFTVRRSDVRVAL